LIHLNDLPTDSPLIADIKNEIPKLQATGITVLAMLLDNYTELFQSFDTYYPVLKNFLIDWGFNGIDLDVETPVTPENIKKLIAQLHTDFGDSFIIILVPVASAVWDGRNLSGFNYHDLMTSDVGKYISWLNLQFYNNFGDLSTPKDYNLAVNTHNYSPSILIAGSDNENNSVDPFPPSVHRTIETLCTTYVNPGFGGVFLWAANASNRRGLSWTHNVYTAMHSLTTK